MTGVDLEDIWKEATEDSDDLVVADIATIELPDP